MTKERALVISDLHLGTKFNLGACNALINLLEDVDRVFINGDFFDSYICSFNDFILSEWSLLFGHFLAHDAIYLWGNHDPRRSVDHNVNLFSVSQCKVHKESQKGKDLVITHGDNLITSLEDNISPKMLEVFKRLYAISQQNDVSKQFASPILKLIEKLNHKKIIEYMKKRQRNSIYICGHTHTQFSSEKLGYYNSGRLKPNKIEYIVFDHEKIVPNSIYY